MEKKMANVINGITYSYLAQQIGNAIRITSGAQSYLYNAVLEIAAISDVLPTIDLISTFNNTYTLQVGTLASTSSYQNAARALNGHVLTRATTATGTQYTNINDWFVDQAINGTGALPAGYTLATPLGTISTSNGVKNAVTVPTEWVSLCASVGTTITLSDVVTY
jgi:hypothetical protein